jgi:opacity protein-like surface antigen
MQMKRNSWACAAILAMGACGASTAALAEDPVGFYIGAGVGESTVRSDDPAYGLPGYYNDHQTAWQGVFGVRPLPFVGAEAEYIDFGQPSSQHRSYNDPNYFGTDSHPRAAAVYAVGYLPIPIPYLDIFVKGGGARLKMDITEFTYSCGAVGACKPVVVGESRDAITQTKFAYGVGVQSKLPFGLTVRAEYERIASPFGDPDALMVSAFWRF